MRHTLLSLGAVLLCCAGAPVQSRTAAASRQTRATAPRESLPRANDADRRATRPLMQRAGGLYFGVSQGDDGECGWLLWIDGKSSHGKLYAPPEMLDLSQLEVFTGGRVIFRSGIAFGELVYSFEGRIHLNKILGTLQANRLKGPPRAGKNKFSLSFRRIAGDLTGRRERRGVSGVYSNVEYVEEGGDLIGTELVLIQRGRELEGILTKYEGAPNGSLPIRGAVTSGGKLRFTTRGDAGIEEYSGEVTMGKPVLTLRNSAVGKVVLPRRKDLHEMFSPGGRSGSQ